MSAGVPAPTTRSPLLLYLRLLGGLVLEEDGRALTGRAAQKRRLALLALLAAAPGRGLSRDRITGMIWPEKEDEQARHLLSVAAYEIRKELGDDVVASRGDDLVLDPLLLGSDLMDFEAAVERGDYDEAIALYRGPFLDGFFLGESVAFDQWMEEQRAALTRRHREVLVRRAEAIEAGGDRAAAADAWRKAANADRFDSRVALHLLRALDAAGNRAGALQFARIHEALLEEEFGTAPDPAFTAAVEEIRNRTEPVPAETESPSAPTSPTSPMSASRPGEPAGTRDAGAPPAGGPPPARPRPVVLVGIFFLLVVIGGYLATQIGGTDRGGPLRVMVLPFSHPDPGDEAFAHGLSEEIMDALAGVEGVRVPAWSASVALQGAEATEAAARLDVDHVVEGRVHRDGDSLRIRVQLTDPDGFARWTQSYDRSAGEVFATWDEIALAVLDALEVELTRRQLPTQAGETRDPAAYDLFVRGRHAWFKRSGEGLGQAVAYFNRALQRDPDYARAHAGLADAYNVMGAYEYGVLPPDSAYPVALAEAERALELAPALGEAHAARANTLFYYFRDFEAAEAAYRRAIQLYPHYAEAHHWYSLLLMAMGEEDAATREVERALQLDSLSPVMRTSYARHLYFRGEPERALEVYRETLDVDPTFIIGHLGEGVTLLELGRHDAAIASFRRVLELSGGRYPLARALLANAHGRAGRPDSARAALAYLQQLEDQGAWIAPEYFALVHLGIGDDDDAIDAFARSLDVRSNAVPFFGIEPLARPLWDEPRFQALIQRGRQPVQASRPAGP